MRSRRRGILVTLLVLLSAWLGLYYYGHVDRVPEVLDAEGWHLEFTHARWTCHVCTGHVERLTCLGKPVNPPRLHADDRFGGGFLRMSTPFGDSVTFSR